MFAATGKNELRVFTTLNMRSNKCLYILFFVRTDLLEFVECYYAWFVSHLQESEYLL